MALPRRLIPLAATLLLCSGCVWWPWGKNTPDPTSPDLPAAESEQKSAPVSPPQPQPTNQADPFSLIRKPLLPDIWLFQRPQAERQPVDSIEIGFEEVLEGFGVASANRLQIYGHAWFHGSAYEKLAGV